ncbi:MAG: hypothetical protein HYT08_03875 [Candidatus Levybacteria bacterium]|nr:hypothetical protein [Candidatus Levybacteria bacterium]
MKGGKIMTITFKIKNRSNDEYVGSLKELAKLVNYELAFNRDERLFTLSTDKYEITDVKLH